MAIGGDERAMSAGAAAGAGAPPRPSSHGRRPLRVGHKGAAHLADANTLAAFEAALQAGVDMIEFDVLSERPDGSGRLLVAHDYSALREAAAPPLELAEALDHLAGGELADVQLDVDIKRRGYSMRVVEELRRAGLLERSLLSSTYSAELDLIRSQAPEVRVGWSVPRAARDYTASPLTALPALALLQAARILLPRRASAALRAGRFDAIMAHWRLVTAALVRAVGEAGGQLYAWTVDDAATIERLSAIGVDGIITNDPRLFGADARAAQSV